MLGLRARADGVRRNQVQVEIGRFAIAQEHEQRRSDLQHLTLARKQFGLENRKLDQSREKYKEKTREEIRVLSPTCKHVTRREKRARRRHERDEIDENIAKIDEQSLPAGDGYEAF